MTMNTDHHTTETGDDGMALTIWMFGGLAALELSPCGIIGT